MIPTRALGQLTVHLCGTIVALLFSTFLSSAQCTPPGPPTFTAVAGPVHRQITLNIGGVNTQAFIEIYSDEEGWAHFAYASGNGSLLVIDRAHNETVQFRARNSNNCYSDWAYASATTFDIGQPWLNVTPGPGNSVYVQTGAVVDVNSSLFWSTDGGATFAYHSTWNNQPPLIVGLVPNQTYFFYAQIDPGGDDGSATPQSKGSGSQPIRIMASATSPSHPLKSENL